MAEEKKYRSGQYGLILPKKDKPTPVVPKKTNIFNDDSEEEEQQDWLTITRKANIERSMQLKESTKVLRKALEEDPSVFQYDEQYDHMVEERESSRKKEKLDRKPKYIDNLLKTANIRKREFDSRIERDVQKEREAEGDLYKDKESFVTTAYRAKMEEIQRGEEEQKRQDAIDDMTDVTKQSDLGGFYRHIFKTTVGEDEKKRGVKEEQLSIKKGLVAVEERHEFRKLKKPETQPAEEKERKDPMRTSEQILPRRPSPPPDFQGEEQDSSGIIKSPEPLDAETPDIPPRVCLWKKRTVDQVFEEALQRYLLRKENQILKPAVVRAS